MRKLAIFEEHKCTKEVQLAPPVPRATAVMLACVPAPAPDAGNVCNLSTTGLILYNNENNLPPNISEANVVLCHINLFWYFLIYLHILDSIYKYLDTFIHFFVFSISYRNDDHHIFLPAHLQRPILHLVAVVSVHMLPRIVGKIKESTVAKLFTSVKKPCLDKEADLRISAAGGW